ncbi:MAG: hypothetical protein COT88_00100 [Candidatus Colwellbacteria bacterium CG10_big_fil_rev_8_21_14_0_10_41_28]|uniref:AI-2E family transporter n=1 Tax=Candidatus Colwellbacteria bacterium CG10_big_fil_rev_8_21_14_0_10_41_28 TaxID=1974539 RepID=A0A2H0VHZ6_9BACT|nr:MAG: hypothetical protein COT88_00100 [Candidatus Colwellbacteria bacterium CG10_big_fil_rev_8_21_14_0_10_41_28]
MGEKTLDISWRSLWRVILMLGFVVALFMMRETIAVLLLALLVSTIFDRPVDFLERKGIPRILGTILMYLATLIVLAILFYTIIPIAVIEINNLVKNLDSVIAESFGLNLPTDPTSIINADIQEFTTVLLSGGISFIEVLGGLVGGVTFVLAVLVLSFYLTVSKDGVSDFLIAVFPESMEDKILDLYQRTKKRIGNWFQGQMMLSLIVGTTVFIGLTLLDIRFALALALTAAVFELIPIVGPIFAGALAVSVALSQSITLGISVLVLFLIIQQLENNILVPLVMRKSTGVHPVMILVAILGGAQIAGFVGVLLAVPVAVFIQEIGEEWINVKSNRRRNRLSV